MRHAVYYAPEPSDQLHALASHWLGRDAATGAPLARPRFAADLLPDEEQERLVAAPARYGFHATLKAPFRLAEGVTGEDVQAAVERLSGDIGAVRLPVIALRRLDRFFALVPAIPSQALSDFAARIVAELDHLRAPATPDEIARRRAAGLTGPQEANLERWGYPYVMDEFRFHMTLTGPVPPGRAAAVERALESHFEPVIGRALAVDRLCVFVEPAEGAPMTLHSAHEIRRPFGAGFVRTEAL